MRNHGVIARQDAGARTNTLRFATSDVGNRDLRCACGIAEMTNSHRRTVQADADARTRHIQLPVVEASGDDILHRAPRCDGRNHLTDEETRDRGVAIRKMEDVGFGYSTHAG